MEIVSTVFTSALNMLVQLWNTCVGGSWGIFGTFVIFYAILRKIGKTFNNLKS